MLVKLIAKDLRLCRIALLLLLGTVAGSYAIAWLLAGKFMEAGASQADAFAICLGSGADLAGFLVRIPLVIIGALVASKEYDDRSGEFLTYLPPSKAMVISSKWIAAFGVGAAVYWIAVSTRLISVQVASDPILIEEASVGFLPSLLVSAVVAFCMMSTAMGVAPILKSSGAATFAGILATIPLIVILKQTKYYWDWPSTQSYNTAFVLLAIAQAFSVLAIGAVYYVHDRD